MLVKGTLIPMPVTDLEAPPAELYRVQALQPKL